MQQTAQKGPTPAKAGKVGADGSPAKSCSRAATSDAGSSATPASGRPDLIPAASPRGLPQDVGELRVSSKDEASGIAAPNSTETGSAAEPGLQEAVAALHIDPSDSDQTGRSTVEEPDGDDEDYESLLQKMRQALSLKGPKPKKMLQPLLETFDLAGIANYIKQGKVKNIIVMCGAGISVSAGIPDFRSPKTGLYHNLQKFDLPHPQAVFELDFFREHPEPFYQLAKELFPGNFEPTPTHYFMTLLHHKGLLLRCFTQNIDSLERQAGLPADRIVAAHGNFDTAHCINCRREVSLADVKAAVDAGAVCRCSECRGLVKPDIVFFGEALPKRFFQRVSRDFPQADLLIVMGTSLVVNPFASLIDRVDKAVPRVLINRERAGEADATLLLLGQKGGFQFEESHRDALFLGDCDDGVRELADALGWATELQGLVDAGAARSAKPAL